MSYFATVLELRDYAQRFVDLGLGGAVPMLDRRGCDCGQGLVRIGDPGEGERVSEDGSMVFISCRRMEA